MKITPLFRIISGYLSASKWNTNAQRIEDGFENTISRNGSTPNDMQTNLDLGGHRIINVGQPSNLTDAVRLQDIVDISDGSISVNAAWDDITDKPTEFQPSSHQHPSTDITDLGETVEDIIGSKVIGGTNVSVSYSDITGETTVSTTGSISTAWGDLTDIPSTFTPSAHNQAFSTITDGQEAVEDLIGASVIAGTNVTVSYDDGTGKTTVNATGGGGGSNIIDFVGTFGGVGDMVTNNDTAFASAEASSYKTIYMPQGYYYTTRTIANLTKHYWGPGIIWRGAGNGSYTGYSRYDADVHPTTDPLIAYGFAEDNSFGTMEHFFVSAGTRKNFDRYLGTPGFPTYFWGPSTAHTVRYDNSGGWSGFSGLTTTTITSGVSTSVTIAGGTVGWNIGDTIGFTNMMDGVISETRVLTGVNTGAGTISWSGTLSNTYATGSTITHGYRTMQAAYFTHAKHSGGGDCYIHTARAQNTYQRLPSQTSFEQGSTSALFGGELILSADMAYGTGWEGIYQDTGFDAGVAGTVNSYVRTVNTGNYGLFWIHDLCKMDGGGTGFAAYGLKRIDGVYVAALAAHTGLDFTRSSFDVAAVALPFGEKISFDAQISGPGPTNGNGWVATTDGGMFIRGMTAGSKTLELSNGTYFLRLKAGGALTTNAVLQNTSYIDSVGSITSTSGYIHGVGGVAVSTGAKFWLDGPGGNTYIHKTGSSVQLVKNGVVAQTW